jgi:hypothetical protein
MTVPTRNGPVGPSKPRGASRSAHYFGPGCQLDDRYVVGLHNDAGVALTYLVPGAVR